MLPGQARPDWQIVCALSTRMGQPMHFPSPESVFAEFVSLTESYRGLTYAALGASGKLWPMPAADSPERPVLFADRFPTATGRGRFVPCEFAPAAELPDSEYPLVLNTGHQLEHWHTGTMTRRAAALDAIAPSAAVEVHPEDLARLGLADGSMVTVRSRRHHAPGRGRATHPARQHLHPLPLPRGAANLLTNDVLDPFGKIPEFKFCAVRLEAAGRM
jgi:formate dehydrogenase major subunit